MSKPDDAKRPFIEEAEEFEFFSFARRFGRKALPIMGVGVIVKDASEEGDALYSGRLTTPRNDSAPEGNRAWKANFYFPPDVLNLLLLGENEGSLNHVAIRGSADLIASRVAGLMVADPEWEDSVYEIARDKDVHIKHQHLGLVSIYR